MTGAKLHAPNSHDASAECIFSICFSVYTSAVVGPGDTRIADRIAEAISVTGIPYISYGEFSDSEISAEKSSKRNRLYAGVAMTIRAKVIL